MKISTRTGKEKSGAESNGELAMYFVANNLTQPRRPNRDALKFHQATCLVWRMAGGAESKNEHCPDDDDGLRPCRLPKQEYGEMDGIKCNFGY